MLHDQQEIINRADTALIESCGFKNVKVTTVETGFTLRASGKIHDQGVQPTPYRNGELKYQEETFGDGIGDVHIKLHIGKTSIYKVEMDSTERYKGACNQWISAVKTQIPQIEIIFKERGKE